LVCVPRGSTAPNPDPAPKPDPDPAPKKTAEEINRELYAETQDKKAKLKAERAEKESIAAKLKEAEDKIALYGADPDKVAELLKAESDREEAALLEAENFKEAKEKAAKDAQDRIDAVKEAAEKEKKDLQEQLDKRDSQQEELLRTNTFANSIYIREKLTVGVKRARALFDSHYDVGEDGDLVAYDAPVGAPNRKMILNERGDPASFEESFEKIIEADEDRDTLKRTKVKVGSGSGKPGKGSETGKGDKKKLTGVDKLIAQREREQQRSA